MFDDNPYVKKYLRILHISILFGFGIIAIAFLTTNVFYISGLSFNLRFPAIIVFSIGGIMGGIYAVLKGVFAIKEKEMVIFFELNNTTMWRIPIRNQGTTAIVTGIIYLILGSAILYIGIKYLWLLIMYPALLTPTAYG